MASIDDVRVLIIADDPLTRAGLAAVLAGQPGCLVVGQSPAQADLLAEVEAVRPDAVLWDLGWSPAPATNRLAELADALPPVVALLPGDDRLVSFAGLAWQAGARGLLSREAQPEQLAAALAAAMQRLAVVDWSVLGETPLAPRAPGDASDQSVGDLTPRELEVLQLMAEGLPNKAIARRLGISDHTVKFHVNAILGKLGAQSRTEAVILATRLGLLSL